MSSLTPFDWIAFIIIEGNQVLAEKRRLSKQSDPGAIALPGGHLDIGESPEQALYRELNEELGIVPINFKYVCTLLHKGQELQRIHYFGIEKWAGRIENSEAEDLLWIPITKLEKIDIVVDRTAVSEYFRIYKS
jgi:8-oxo-dGTP diphosphatase